MTRSRRVLGVLYGIMTFIAGCVFIIADIKHSLPAVLLMLQAGMLIRGFSALYYYLTMARLMVGGKTVLYRSVILLDLGAMAGSLVGHELIYAAFYLAILHIFSGVIAVMRAKEARSYGGHWKLKMLSGATNILLAVAIVVGSWVFRNPEVAVLIYGIGLMYSAVLRVISAFRRTDIVYIQ